MKWEKVSIKDICTGIFDGPHATPPISKEGAVYLGISNITADGRLDLSNIKYISDNNLEKWTKRVTPQKGDIVFSYEATLNLYAIIPENFRGCLGRRLALVRPNSQKVNYKFLYYYFFSDEWKGIIKENTITGATVDRIPLIKFPEFKVSIPPLDTQKKIADILSHYDDLIENNQKQIALLEEAARRLYNEWFVKLHFPGYENVKIVDGVPEGWKEGKLQDIGIFIRGKTITQSDLKEGNIPVVAGGLEPAYYHNKANTKSPVITISASGANAGYTKLYNTAVWSSDSSFLDEDNTDFLYWIYCYLKTNTQILSNLQKGSAQPHVYAKDINDINLMIPNRNLIMLFNTKSKIIFDKIGILSKQNRFLQEARDRLLPRLMNGEIEVK